MLTGGCNLYWIRLPCHKDVTTDGYIGVTTNTVGHRFKQHKSACKSGRNTLSKALLKYGDEVVVDTLLIGSEVYCYLMEQRLRPVERTGWNVAPGGHKPPPHKSHTAEAKRKISEASRANAHTEAQIRARQLRVGVKRSEEQRERMRAAVAKADRKPWNTSRADKSIWKQANKFYIFFEKNPSVSSAASAASHGLREYALRALYSKFKQSWRPLDDPEWVQWAQE